MASDRVTVIAVEASSPHWSDQPDKVRVFVDGAPYLECDSWASFFEADRVFGLSDAYIVRVVPGIKNPREGNGIEMPTETAMKSKTRCRHSPMTPTPREDTMTAQTEREPMLNDIQNRVERASHGKWTACRMTHAERGDDLTPEELGEYVTNSVRKSADASGSSAFLFVSVEKADGQPADVCHVGNGPTSPQNADFIQHAPDDVRYLLAQMRERDAQIARLEHDYNQLAGSTSKEVLTLRTERDAAQRDRDVFKTAFKELHATVQGECPALLDPDRGGSDVLWKLCAVALSKRTS